MGDLKLQGSQGMWGKEAPVQHREVNQGVTPAQIIKATQDNNLDELVVVDQQAKMHVVYADELSLEIGGKPKEGSKVNLPFTHLQIDVASESGEEQGRAPKIGDKVYLPFIEDPVTILHLDNESNEDYSFLAAGLVGVWMNKNGGMSGDDAAIRQLSHKPESGKTQPDKTDTPWEIPKDFVPYSPEKLQSETAWALDLEKEVKKGHNPSSEETKRYKDTYFAIKVADLK